MKFTVDTGPEEGLVLLALAGAVACGSPGKEIVCVCVGVSVIASFVLRFRKAYRAEQQGQNHQTLRTH